MSRRDPLVLRPVGGALWEYVCESGTGLEADELKALNQEGYIYHSERLEVVDTRSSTWYAYDYIDIYLFTRLGEQFTLPEKQTSSKKFSYAMKTLFALTLLALLFIAFSCKSSENCDAYSGTGSTPPKPSSR